MICGSEVELRLPGRQALPRYGLQRLQLGVIARRAEVLDVPRPAAGGPHDLHRRRQPALPRKRLVHPFTNRGRAG